MTRQRFYVLAALVAIATIAAGTAYALLREPKYQSTATVALAPSPEVSRNALPTVIGSFGNSATIGTYVELIASKDTLRDAGSPAVDVDVRAVPDTRVITVTTLGRESEVRPALVSLLGAASAAQDKLRDSWQLRVVQGAQPPVTSGPSRAFILAATYLMAALGVLLLGVLLRALGLLPESTLRRGGRPARASVAPRPVGARRTAAASSSPARSTPIKSFSLEADEESAQSADPEEPNRPKSRSGRRKGRSQK